MAKNIREITARLGAKVVAQVPEVGGGTFGAARLARIVETFQSRLAPTEGHHDSRSSQMSNALVGDEP